MVRAFAVFTAPLIVRRFPELFLQVWAFPTFKEALIVSVKAFALSTAAGAPPVQLEFVPQVVLVVPVQTRSAAKTACGAKNKINKNARGDGKIDCRPKRLFPRPRRRIWGRI